MADMPPKANHERWAVYYAPPRDHSLWRAGCRWLGRDPETGEIFPPPGGLAAEHWRAVVAMPQRYGFHATVKPPFRLRADTDSTALAQRLQALVSAQTPFTMALVVARLGEFLALRPLDDETPAQTLAGDCVRLLDGLRAPVTTQELERRQSKPLSQRQLSLLRRWGYPYVFDQFRFHLTLSGVLDSSEQARLRPIAEAFFRPALATPIPVAELALYRQRLPNSPFQLVARFPFGESA